MTLEPSNQTNLFGHDKYLNTFINLYKKKNYLTKFFFLVKKELANVQQRII